LKGKFNARDKSMSFDQQVEWLVRSGLTYENNTNISLTQEDIYLDTESIQSLLQNFKKYYSNSEISIALDNLGDGNKITKKTLASYLEDEIYEIDTRTTNTHYENMRNSRRSITMDFIAIEKSRSKAGLSVRKESVEYQEHYGKYCSPVGKSNLSLKGLSTNYSSNVNRRENIVNFNRT
jgi:hypothetical protein